jgi:hypothetical protein
MSSIFLTPLFIAAHAMNCAVFELAQIAQKTEKSSYFHAKYKIKKMSANKLLLCTSFPKKEASLRCFLDHCKRCISLLRYACNGRELVKDYSLTSDREIVKGNLFVIQ